MGSKKLLDGAFTLRLYPIVYDELDGVPVIAVADIMGNEYHSSKF